MERDAYSEPMNRVEVHEIAVEIVKKRLGDHKWILVNDQGKGPLRVKNQYDHEFNLKVLGASVKALWILGDRDSFEIGPDDDYFAFVYLPRGQNWSEPHLLSSKDVEKELDEECRKYEEEEAKRKTEGKEPIIYSPKWIEVCLEWEIPFKYPRL
jgi:hypothetical protein